MTANVVNISGGKDSTATLLLAIERGVENLSAVFADTGHEHPSTYEYIEYLRGAVGVPIATVRASFKAQIAKKREYIVRKWADDGVPQERIDRALEVLVPTGVPFLDLCLWKGRFPSTKARFCTEELKVIPLVTQFLAPLLKQDGEVLSWQGVRRDESRARADLPERDEGDLPGLWNYRPILDWTASDCFEMHRRHGIRHNPLYEDGMGRVGCMPCINVRKDELAAIAQRYPEELERVATWERLVSDSSKRGFSTFLPGHYDGTAEEVFRKGRIERRAEWAMTSRGGAQYDLLKTAADPSVCSSVYGLCE